MYIHIYIHACMHAHIHKYIYHVYILTCWRMWARRERWVAKTWPDTKKKIHIPRIHAHLLAQVGAAGALGGKDVA